MILNDLKKILIAEEVCIYGEPIRAEIFKRNVLQSDFTNDESEKFIFINEEKEELYEKYGSYEVERMYDSDDVAIVIDICNTAKTYKIKSKVEIDMEFMVSKTGKPNNEDVLDLVLSGLKEKTSINNMKVVSLDYN